MTRTRARRCQSLVTLRVFVGGNSSFTAVSHQNTRVLTLGTAHIPKLRRNMNSRVRENARAESTDAHPTFCALLSRSPRPLVCLCSCLLFSASCSLCLDLLCILCSESPHLFGSNTFYPTRASCASSSTLASRRSSTTMSRRTIARS